MGEEKEKKNKYDYIQEKLDYINSIIAECEELRKEWTLRIAEAKQARENYEGLIKEIMEEHKQELEDDEEIEQEEQEETESKKNDIDVDNDK